MKGLVQVECLYKDVKKPMHAWTCVGECEILSVFRSNCYKGSLSDKKKCWMLYRVVMRTTCPCFSLLGSPEALCGCKTAG